MFSLSIRPAFFALVLSAGVALCTPAAAQEATLDLRGLLATEAGLRLDGRQLDRATLLAIYQAHDFIPLWVGEPEREAALLHALGGAAEHGLDPAAFAVPLAPPVERELLLTDAFLRYATALARGRVESHELESDWAFGAPAFDPGATLDRALAGDVGAVLAGLAPVEPGYRQLQDALARYRRIAAGGGWRHVPDTAKLKLYDHGPAVTALRRRLAAEGYLAADALAGGFDAAVEQAVRRFQAQHGVAADGAVGSDTFRALNVSATARVEQIRANLERWRELPRTWPKTRIEVNVPAATLTVIEKGEPRLVMRAIVGAEDHPTPVMRAHMSAVLFNPSWTIPASIVKNEILPKAKRDAKYLERNHYVYRGAVLQQLPGAGNALGRVKFEMPNIYDVYLHDTPSHPLFKRVSRSLSHGCVRLENPRELALYLLSGRSGWAEEDIDRVIAAGQTERVPLPHSLPVYLLYWTAFVDAEGAVEFRDDVYARDQRLTTALAARDADERGNAVPAPDQTASDCCHSD
ncbi:MAG TPA: L,D-transpeptidase family protein [Stellaceae bacterium]